jgi:sodium/hydrogen antiporter
MILAAFILLLFVHGLVSRRLERTVITAPIVFTLAGILLQPVFTTFQQNAVHKSDMFLHLAEIATVLLSIFAHGLSAVPAINWHARHLENS